MNNEQQTGQNHQVLAHDRRKNNRNSQMHAVDDEVNKFLTLYVGRSFIVLFAASRASSSYFYCWLKNCPYLATLFTFAFIRATMYPMVFGGTLFTVLS